MEIDQTACSTPATTNILAVVIYSLKYRVLHDKPFQLGIDLSVVNKELRLRM